MSAFPILGLNQGGAQQQYLSIGEFIVTWLSWIGHLSFFLSALSFMMSSILLLRLLAIGSLLVGIAYNSMIAMGFANGVPNPELWNVVGWLVTFLLINVGQSIRLLVQNNEIKLPEIERSLLAIAAPLMRTRDWAKLMAASSTQKLAPGDVLIEVGDDTKDLIMIESGDLMEIDDRKSVLRIGRGTWLGEVSMAINEQYGGSPVKVVAQNPVVIRRWSYESISKLFNDVNIHNALIDGFFRGVVRKRVVLLPADGHLAIDKEVALSADERQIHAKALPHLTTAQFKKIFQMGEPASFEEGQAIENSKQLGIVTAGALRVTRDDGHSLDLREGYFVGELAYLGNRPNKVGAKLTALTKAQVTWWSHGLLAELKDVDPPLYASFMQSIARDVAIKLSQPMTPPPGTSMQK